MERFKGLIKKELFFYFKSPTGFIVATLFALLANFLFIKDFFLRGSSSMRSFFDLAPWLLMIFIPALSMRSFSEEKKNNTYEVLLTLPITELEIIAAKFLSLCIFTTITFLLTTSIPITLLALSKPAMAQIIISYFGIFLLAFSYISISLFFSSITKNQITAFLVSAFTVFILNILSSEVFSSIIPQFIQSYLTILTPLYHFDNFVKGVVELRSVFYFFSLIGLFIFWLFLNLKKRD